MTPYVTKALQNTHEKLKKANVEPFKKPLSKTIKGCLVIVDYKKLSCSVKVYDKSTIMDETDTSIFCSDNRKEICSLFGL